MAAWGSTLLLVAGIVGIILHARSRPVEETPPPPKRVANVETATVRAQPYQESLTLPAALEAERSATVSPELAGRLARWFIAEGELVAAGQLVAALDTQTLEANLRELQVRKRSAELGVERAEASLRGAKVGLENAHKEEELRGLALESAKADLNLAKIEHDRVLDLVNKLVMDKARLDTAENARTQARIRVDQATQALESARLGVRAAVSRVEEASAGLAFAKSGADELDASIDALQVQIAKTKLHAPIAGRLEEHLAEPGEVVGAGQELAHIYDLSTLRAAVNVPDRFVPFLDAGNPAVGEYVRLNHPGAVREVSATVVVPGLPKLTGGEAPGVELPARIARVAQSADAESNTFEVELQVANPGGALKEGVIARARIDYLTYPEAIVIPLKAVQVTDAGPRVLVVEDSSAGKVAVVRDIEAASVREDQLLVLSGLTPGDHLVVAGWKGLVSGEPVNVIMADGIFTAAGGE